jgi:ubiquinone/menaquinone biosynthesis C-methylase UbiE
MGQVIPAACFILGRSSPVGLFMKKLFEVLKSRLNKSAQPSIQDNILPKMEILVGTRNQGNREQWLERTLADIPTGSRILDAGAGELRYKHLCSRFKYVSQDFAQYNGQGDGKGLQTGVWDQTKLDIVSDIARIPESDSSFDAVMCIEVLEHVPYPVDALRELARLLKPGGHLIVTAPFCSLTHFAPYFYQTGYSRYFYEYWLEKFNFEILEIEFNGNYFEYLAQEIRRIPQVSHDYTKTKIDEKEHLVINQMLVMLNKLSEKGDSSSEFLCFGSHVLARKRI